MPPITTQALQALMTQAFGNVPALESKQLDLGQEFDGRAVFIHHVQAQKILAIASCSGSTINLKAMVDQCPRLPVARWSKTVTTGMFARFVQPTEATVDLSDRAAATKLALLLQDLLAAFNTAA